MRLGPRIRQRVSTARQLANDPCQVDYEAVARLAYAYYEQRGREDGYAFDDWIKAEAVVRQPGRARGQRR